MQCHKLYLKIPSHSYDIKDYLLKDSIDSFLGIGVVQKMFARSRFHNFQCILELNCHSRYTIFFSISPSHKPIIPGRATEEIILPFIPSINVHYHLLINSH